jgi:hypothetical protein
MGGMLDRHAVQELVRAQVPARAIAKQFGVSVRTVRRFKKPSRPPVRQPIVWIFDREIDRWRPWRLTRGV